MHSLSLSLARHAGLVAVTHDLVAARGGRLARIAAVFAFVLRLAAAAEGRSRPSGTGLREGDLSAALLSAMLRAAGERARVDYTREMALVRVAVCAGDVGRLPPWARLLRAPGGGLELALAPRGQWTPAGHLPPAVSGALERRRASIAVAC